jgi:uncharacterized integral membrane protein
LLVLGVVLVVQNQQAVATRLLFWTAKSPRFALPVLVFLLGIVG